MLVVVYVFNIKYLPLRGEGITFFLVNVVPFLNLVLAGFVLASIAARFIFPSVSLEGRTLWLLRSSPMPVRDLLWAKFWVGTLPLLVLALGIVGVTDALLQVSDFMFAVSVMTIALMTLALCGMALGFGTLFPQFETENAAQIPTSFGGLLFMIAAVGLIAGGGRARGAAGVRLPLGAALRHARRFHRDGLRVRPCGAAVRRGDGHSDRDREAPAGGGGALTCRAPRRCPGRTPFTAATRVAPSTATLQKCEGRVRLAPTPSGSASTRLTRGTHT